MERVSYRLKREFWKQFFTLHDLAKEKKQNKQKTPNSYLQLVQALTLQTPDSRISL